MNLKETKEKIATTENELHIIRNERTKGILLMAKARWNVEGERNSKYFCNLDKGHYKEKKTPKTHNGHDLTDKQDIIEAQFYETLYTSRNCNIERRHEDECFENENPFVTKLTINEKDEIEGPITLNECACVLRK